MPAFKNQLLKKKMLLLCVSFDVRFTHYNTSDIFLRDSRLYVRATDEWIIYDIVIAGCQANV